MSSFKGPDRDDDNSQNGEYSDDHDSQMGEHDWQADIDDYPSSEEAGLDD